MERVIIIGGGAAGLAAAIAAAECGDRVTVLERMDRVGRKLLATGNGRCNLMNTGSPRYPGGSEMAERVLALCGPEEQRRFWLRHGLPLRQEEGGRVYPVSGQASSVLDVLRLNAEALGVDTLTETEARQLRPGRHGWTVVTDARELRCDRVIVAGGGCAQPKLGSNGSCYALLEALGHTLVKPRPVLCQLETETQPIRGLSGIRVRCGVSILRKGSPVHRETGELLFADYGVSGVCVMQCARFAQTGDRLSIDLLSGLGLTEEDAQRLLRQSIRQRPEQELETLLTGLTVPRLGLALMKAAGVMAKGRRMADLRENELQALCRTLADFGLRVTGSRGFDQAQVTAGGIRCGEFEPTRMASRLAEGLHAAGEVLDVDGDCGGFNLMFAFGSGILAGLNGRVPNDSEESYVCH